MITWIGLRERWMKGISGTLECFYFPRVSHKSAPGGGLVLLKEVIMMEIF